MTASERAAYDAGLEIAARTAEQFSIEKRSIHPDVAWDQMSGSARTIAHMACQNVAAAIRELKGSEK